MVFKFTYGFEFEGISYGWLKKELYRFPYTNKKNMAFGFKKMNQIIIGNKVGYRLSSKKRTIEQLESITNNVDYTYIKVTSKDCPF